MWWHRIGRVLLGIVTVVVGLVALALVVVFVITNTDWGRERVRRFAEQQLQNRVHGQVSLGRITGNLLSGMTVHDVAIRDSTGAPFLVADAVHVDYKLQSFLRQRLYFDDVRLENPLVVLDKPPEGSWNYKRIFASDTTGAPGGPSAWTRYIHFTDVTVVDGRVVVRSPWHPDEGLSPAAQDSMARDAVQGGTRLMVVRVPDGYQKVVELQHVNLKAPMVRLADPAYEDRFAEVASLSMTAYPFRPPAAEVRDMRGPFHFDDDSLWWRNVYAELPGSRVSGDGKYEFDDGDMTLDLRGAPVALADMRWIYPRLPSEGQGTLDFLMRWDGSTQTYIAQNADIRSGDTRIRGDFGFTLADTFAIHDTDLQIAHLDTRLVEQLVPHFDSPRRGTLDGHVQLAGGKNAMRVDADVRFADVADGTSHVVANGALGFGNGIRASDLRLRLDPLQVELARSYLADLPISGIVTGTALVNGNTNTQLAIRGDLRHTDRGAVSELSGRATVQLAGRTTQFVADVTAKPLSLVEVGRIVPAAGLRGWVSGPIHVAGTPSAMRFDADLRLPEGGALAARGTANLSGARKSYDVAATMRVVNLQAVTSRAPATSLTARLAAHGSGFQPATMRSTITADFAASSFSGVTADSGAVRVTIANGLVDVRRLHLAGQSTLVDASGTFGLVAGRQGELTYQVKVDSLRALDRWIPGVGSDTGVVRPRPARVTAAFARARADSARIARTTEVERAISGAPPPRLVVDTPRSIPRSALSGSLYASGKLRGNIQRFDLTGAAGGSNLVVRGNSAANFRTVYAWTDARTPEANLAVGFQGDTISVAGFEFDSLDARVGYRDPDGRVEIVVRQGDDREYALKGDFLLREDLRQLRVANLSLRFDTTAWVSTHPATIDWRGTGVEVHSLELRHGEAGRIFVDGTLPTEGVSDLRVAIDNFQVGDVVALLQSDLQVEGLVSLSGTLRGTLRAPLFRGAFGVVNGTYQETTLPELHGTFAYADQTLTTRVDALRNGGQPMAVAQGRLPIDLALTGVTGPRLLDRPLALDVTADSLPLGLIPDFTDLVSGVDGLAVGRIAVRGTLRDPNIIGGLALTRASVTIAASGARIAGITGSVRMLNDSIYVDSLVGYSKGDIRLRGAIGVSDWSQPRFNLYLVAHNAEVLRNDLGQLRADIGLALTGPLNRAYLSGQVTVTQGVVYAPQPTSKNVINAGDPALFAVADTSKQSVRELFPTTSSLLQTTRVDVAVAVNRNTWVRSKDMNIEIYTDYPVMVRSRGGDLAFTGTVTTDRGEYTFLSKRFQISRGSATFIGESDINPTLQVTGEYAVQLTGAPAISIKVLIGGTLRRPNLSLESDAQPPRSQSELLTMLAFGRSSSNLLQAEGNSFTGPVAPGDLVGIASRRLAGIAMGVAIQELETEAGRGIGADVFNITPAEVPANLESGNSIGTFLQDTKVEVGKYLNPRTFLGLQAQAQVFGLRLQHRTESGYVYQTYWEPRYLLQAPTLSGQGVIPTTAFGAFVVREWRF